MDSSSNNDQSKVEENFGRIARDELQKVFNDDTKSAESAELASSTTTNDINLNNIVLSGDIGDVNNTTVENTDASPRSRITIDTYVKNFGLVEERLHHIDTSATFDTDNISANSNTHLESQFISSTNEQQNQDQVVTQRPITTTDNLQTQPSIERHIMISYNRESAFDVCQEICLRLRNAGYKVWIDKDDLHGRILQGMAQGIQNSYIVLICYNHNYSKSDYCEKEATYTFQNRIDFIPCRLQASYVPHGWLGIVIADRLYIDFSPPNDFDDSFKKLIDEIESVKTQSQTHPNRTAIISSNDNHRNVEMNNQIMREQFNTIIREYKESINKRDHELHLLEKEELCELIIRLRERLFNDTLSTRDISDSNREQRNQNDDQILRNLFEQSHNQTELLKKITEILSKPIDFKTIVKLSLAFIFIWTVKTHIIDAYLKYK